MFSRLWLAAVARVSSPGDPRHSCVHWFPSLGDSLGSPAGAVVWSRTGVWGPRLVRGCPVLLLFPLPGVPGSSRGGLASPSGSAPRRTQGAGSVSNSGGLACGPRVRIRLGSQPQGETLHIPFDQRPLSEDGLGWDWGRPTGALTGTLENRRLRSPPSPFYIFFSVCHHVPENYCQENEPQQPPGRFRQKGPGVPRAARPLPRVSARRPACPALPALHPGPGLTFARAEPGAGPGVGKAPRPPPAVSLPRRIPAKQGMFRRPARPAVGHCVPISEWAVCLSSVCPALGHCPPQSVLLPLSCASWALASVTHFVGSIKAVDVLLTLCPSILRSTMTFPHGGYHMRSLSPRVSPRALFSIHKPLPEPAQDRGLAE